MATREKAIVDFLYLHPDYVEFDDFEEWRINVIEVLGSVQRERLRELARVFQNQRLEHQVENFISYISS